MRQILRNNDEILMTKLERMTKCSNPLHRYMVISLSRFNDSTIQRFNVTKSFVIRYSPAAPKLGEGGCFVISSS